MRYLLVFCFAIATFGCSSKKPESNSQPTPYGNKLEEIRLTDLKGKEIDWSQMKGKAVFINFWATWCGPCIKEMPSIQAAIDHLKDEKVVFLLATEESIEKINEFKDQYNFKLEFVQQKTTLTALDILALPTTYIFDRSGKLVFKETSLRMWDTTENLAMIRELVN